MGKTCKTCRYHDEFNFCEKLVIDIRWCTVENERRIKSYYIDERENGDIRPSLITPPSYFCNFYDGNK